MNKVIIGRKKEQQELKDIYNSKHAEFVAIYGRRRVGKTYLVNNYFKKYKCTYFQAVGLQDGSMYDQLENFIESLSETFFDKEPLQNATSWKDAFRRLTSAIENKNKTEKVVLFFDELPWMATDKSGLLQELDYFWNKYWSNNPNLKLIICGSSASWIIKKIINNKGGLHNRVTRQIIVRPFLLHETKEYFKYLGFKFNHSQILELYMALGGVPFYLKNIKKSISAAQNINNLCFRPDGLLFDEFNKLFHSLFKDAPAYIEIIKIIAKTHYGTTRTEIEEKCKLSSKGGTLTDRLQSLEDTGFVLSFVPYSHQKRGVFYRVIDEYALFYLYWIVDQKNTLIKLQPEGNFWRNNYKTPAWHSWSGYAFESICYKHLDKILKALQILNGSSMSALQYHAQKDEQGAQIDLVIDCKDSTICLCEIKYTEQPFVIDKAYAKILTNKLEVFKKITNTTKQIFMSMISANGVKENAYSDDLISTVVTLDDLFQRVC